MIPARRSFPQFLPPDLTALLLLPASVLFGGALFWPGACLVAIRAGMVRQHLAMFVWYGLAVGYDAQALLVAPLFVALAIERRVPLAVVAAAPLCAVAMLAMRLIGVPFSPNLVLPQDMIVSAGAPNIWAIAQALPWIGALPLVGLALSTALGAAAAYTAWFSVRPLGRGALLDAALLCALVLPGLMPGLGSGSFLLAGALAVLRGIETPDARPVALLVVLGLLVAIAGGAPVGGLAMILATVLHARAVLKPAANDNSLIARVA